MIPIRFENLTKVYDSDTVLDSLSFEIKRSERLVVFGPSGCGKTTLLRLIAGFEVPTKGSISIDGNIVSENNRIIRQPEDRNISMVFQDLALWPHLSVKGNIEFSLKAQGVPRNERMQRMLETLEMVQMSDYLNASVTKLSGGQRQRVALARAIITRPHILLMDEPLSSLNEDLSLAIQDEILRLHEKLKFTLLYVTHNCDEVKKIATRTMHLSCGTLKT